MDLGRRPHFGVRMKGRKSRKKVVRFLWSNTRPENPLVLSPFPLVSTNIVLPRCWSTLAGCIEEIDGSKQQTYFKEILYR